MESTALHSGAGGPGDSWGPAQAGWEVALLSSWGTATIVPCGLHLPLCCVSSGLATFPPVSVKMCPGVTFPALSLSPKNPGVVEVSASALQPGNMASVWSPGEWTNPGGSQSGGLSGWGCSASAGTLGAMPVWSLGLLSQRALTLRSHSFAPEPLQGVLRLAPGLLYHPESQGPYCPLGRLWFLSCVAFQVS